MPVKRVQPVPSDINIAQAAEMIPIVEIAKSLGLSEDDHEDGGTPLDAGDTDSGGDTGSDAGKNPDSGNPEDPADAGDSGQPDAPDSGSTEKSISQHTMNGGRE